MLFSCFYRWLPAIRCAIDSSNQKLTPERQAREARRQKRHDRLEAERKRIAEEQMKERISRELEELRKASLKNRKRLCNTIIGLFVRI